MAKRTGPFICKRGERRHLLLPSFTLCLEAKSAANEIKPGAAEVGHALLMRPLGMSRPACRSRQSLRCCSNEHGNGFHVKTARIDRASNANAR